MSVKRHALNYLYNKAETDYQAALMSFELLLNHSAGVGEHSTKDYLDKMKIEGIRYASLKVHG